MVINNLHNILQNALQRKEFQINMPQGVVSIFKFAHYYESSNAEVGFAIFI